MHTHMHARTDSHIHSLCLHRSLTLLSRVPSRLRPVRTWQNTLLLSSLHPVFIPSLSSFSFFSPCCHNLLVSSFQTLSSISLRTNHYTHIALFIVNNPDRYRPVVLKRFWLSESKYPLYLYVYCINTYSWPYLSVLTFGQAQAIFFLMYIYYYLGIFPL